ncbi:MAG: hypothetical protein IKJ08_06745 [Alistipes sp.]|nr:hypothetical protein [Alistipes sp.]
MKKFWNLMLAALVVLGAVACTETGENLDAPKGLSFEATIDLEETRADVVFNEDTGKWDTVWTGNETLTVKSGWTAYDFKNSVDNKNRFVCTNDDVKSLVGKSVEIFLTHDADYNTLNSKAGKAGGKIRAEVESFDPAAGVNLQVESAFLRYSSTSEVTLNASAYIFDYNGNVQNTITLPAGEDVWVAVKTADNVTLSYSIDGEKCKEKVINIAAKKIYNLGELELEKEVESLFGVVGSFQGWDVANPVVMMEKGGVAVARGVELYIGDEFKFAKNKSWDVSYGGKDAVLSAEVGTEYTLVAENSKNIKATKNGKFDIYFNTTTEVFKYECVEEYADLMVDITIDNKANWSPLYITLKSGEDVIANEATVENNKYAVSGDYIGETLSYILSNGTKTLEGNVTITKTGATITLEETVIKLKVQLDTANSKQWWGNTMKIHVWSTGTSFDTSWPGSTMTSEGNYTWSIIVPSELVGKTINYLVHNGNGWQSSDSTVTISADGNTVTGSSIGIN